MLDLQHSFNKQLPGRGHSLSDTNMNYLVFSKEFLVFSKVSKYGYINFVALFRMGWHFPPKIGHTLTIADLEVL